MPSEMELESVRRLMERSLALWKSSQDDRRRLIDDGADRHARDDGLIVFVEDRADVLSGIATTIANGAGFPWKHAEILERTLVLDDPGIAEWISDRGRDYPIYANYIDALEHLRQGVIAVRDAQGTPAEQAVS